MSDIVNGIWFNFKDVHKCELQFCGQGYHLARTICVQTLNDVVLQSSRTNSNDTHIFRIDAYRHSLRDDGFSMVSLHFSDKPSRL